MSSKALVGRRLADIEYRCIVKGMFSNIKISKGQSIFLLYFIVWKQKIKRLQKNVFFLPREVISSYPNPASCIALYPFLSIFSFVLFYRTCLSLAKEAADLIYIAEKTVIIKGMYNKTNVF